MSCHLIESIEEECNKLNINFFSLSTFVEGSINSYKQHIIFDNKEDKMLFILTTKFKKLPLEYRKYYIFQTREEYTNFKI